jgi:hypothetical protein
MDFFFKTEEGFQTFNNMSLVTAETFADPSFNSYQFLSEKHKFIPIETLKSDLFDTLKNLKTELVELINADYADFINLSTRLVGTDLMIHDICRPLADLCTKVEGIDSEMNSVVLDLQEKLDERALLREKKVSILSYLQALLNLFVGIHESIEKVEALLSITGDSQQEDLVVMDGKLIERVAIEYNQLLFLVSEGKGMPFVQNADWRINRIKDVLTSSLTQSLESAFIALVDNPNDSAAIASVSQFLRTYVLIDKIRESEEVFARVIIAPFIGKTIESSIMEMSAEQAAPALEEMYSKIIEFLSEKCGRVIEISRNAFRGTQFNLLIDVVWTDITSAIAKNNIFNPGVPAIFHAV